MDPNTQPQPNQGMQPDPRVASVVKALAMVENGGKIPLNNPSAGQSGELKSIFQYTPGTWKGYSREILGKEVPMSVETESVVTYGKVKKMLDEGYSPDEIASIWNSGKPDAYLRDHRGTNKFGVKYDTPGYVEKFRKFLGQPGNVKGQPSMPSQAPQQAPAPAIASNPVESTKQAGQAKRGMLPELMNKARMARSAAPARIPGVEAPKTI